MVIQMNNWHEKISVHESDDPYLIAQQFCKRCNLGKDAEFIIVKKIQ